MRDLDTLTPLDARNSLLLDRKVSNQDADTFSLAKTNVDVKETSYQPLVHHAAPLGLVNDEQAHSSPASYDNGYGHYASASGGYDSRLAGGRTQGYY